jgi:multiple antibiotic resistance protein
VAPALTSFDGRGVGGLLSGLRTPKVYVPARARYAPSVNESILFGLTAFSSLFAIVDPFAALPAFLALTAGEHESRRSSVAWRASATTILVLSTFALGGQAIFRFFGITIPAFKVAGGILLFTIALEMLRAKPSKTRTTAAETEESAQREDVGVVPVGIPLLSGPGAIASVTLLSARATTLSLRAALFAAIASLGFVTWMTLRSGAVVARILGTTGINLIARIMGLLLAAIAAQLVIDGVLQVLGTLRG